MRDEYRLDGEMIRGPRAKALISSPADGAVLRDRVVRASGIAWAGEAEVTRVELSVDRGESWHRRATGRLRRPRRVATLGTGP